MVIKVAHTATRLPFPASNTIALANVSKLKQSSGCESTYQKVGMHIGSANSKSPIAVLTGSVFATWKLTFLDLTADIF